MISPIAQKSGIFWLLFRCAEFCPWMSWTCFCHLLIISRVFSFLQTKSVAVYNSSWSASAQVAPGVVSFQAVIWGSRFCPWCDDASLKPSMVTSEETREGQHHTDHIDHTGGLFSGLGVANVPATYIMLAGPQFLVPKLMLKKAWICGLPVPRVSI